MRRVEPFQTKPKPSYDLPTCEGAAEDTFGETIAWLDEQLMLLATAGMVYENPQAVCLNPARVVPKGKHYRLVGELKISNRES